MKTILLVAGVAGVVFYLYRRRASTKSGGVVLFENTFGVEVPANIAIDVEVTS